MKEAKREVKVAGIQMSMEVDNKEANVEKAVKLIDRAGREGCKMVLLPEVFFMEYSVFDLCFPRDPAVYRYAEPIPGPTTNKLAEVSKEHGIYVLAPIYEKAGPGIYYNTTAVIAPSGEVIGKYRKTHIPATLSLEKLYFRPGWEFPVWKTNYGKIGVVTCFDRRFPETVRIIALNGAEIVFCPNASSIPPQVAKAPVKRKRQKENWEFLAKCRAYENGVFFVYIGRWGTEQGIKFHGTSLIVNPYGEIIAQAPAEGDMILSATIDLEEVDRARIATPIFRDLRPELYGRLSKQPSEW